MGYDILFGVGYVNPLQKLNVIGFFRMKLQSQKSQKNLIMKQKMKNLLNKKLLKIPSQTQEKHRLRKAIRTDDKFCKVSIITKIFYFFTVGYINQRPNNNGVASNREKQ